MEKTHIQLREIVWEITGECNNNCSYCGSTSIKNKKSKDSTIIKIAEEIAEYPPEEVTITGGDPATLNQETHKKVLDILRSASITCKIMLNVASVKKVPKDIISLYDTIGLSVNTKNDTDLAKDIVSAHTIKDKYTVITNFNLHNIFTFDHIENFVKDNHATWQLQYTIYKNKEDFRALYNNNDALAYLKDKIQKSTANIVIADNMNSNMCLAGSQSVGITYNGEIIPCISMRSWENNIDQFSQGNIVDMPLKYIWLSRFKDYRFKEYKCCKDHCNRTSIGKYVLKNKELPYTDTITSSPFWEKREDYRNPQPNRYPQIIMYAVISSRTIDTACDFEIITTTDSTLNKTYTFGGTNDE